MSARNQLELVSVPPGVYRRPNGTTSTVSRRFALQRIPVTVAQYTSFLRDTGYPTPRSIQIWDGDWQEGPSFSAANSTEDHPVVGISYDDAEAYLAWLSERIGRACRMPTEAEYRRAAQAGSPCGEPCHHATRLPAHFVSGMLRASPRAVGEGPPNELGLMDMHGLIWQWCSDWYDELPEAIDALDPEGPAHPPAFVMWKGVRRASGRVICGGSFSYPVDYSSCHHRHYSMEQDRNFNLGMRVAVSEPR